MPLSSDIRSEWEKAIAAFEANLEQDIAHLFHRFGRYNDVAASLRAICDQQVQASAQLSAGHGQSLFDAFHTWDLGSLGMRRRAEDYTSSENQGVLQESDPHLLLRSKPLDGVGDDDELSEAVVDMIRWIEDEVQPTSLGNDVDPKHQNSKHPCQTQGEEVSNDVEPQLEHKGRKNLNSDMSREEHRETAMYCDTPRKVARSEGSADQTSAIEVQGNKLQSNAHLAKDGSPTRERLRTLRKRQKTRKAYSR
ncbi:hypothetical protein M409DRAFT_61564 [Zasmidium cellare ATCC 36951]|uniref:Uncharacterized protein n=1 Tax=Zasmidium cellare ATCC 36951 TaxID=1080233 RepID=A0A6A6BYB6_ZASCE|nr:uncharacterized protein M409DRAFT_61564 [Zasmidium cellare ATCC 36951]KAF2158552.1 hypothetical protein M409DRAFT_61564 [Zasmidium cellare ATCC 36951]